MPAKKAADEAEFDSNKTIISRAFDEAMVVLRAELKAFHSSEELCSNLIGAKNYFLNGLNSGNLKEKLKILHHQCQKLVKRA